MVLPLRGGDNDGTLESTLPASSGASGRTPSIADGVDSWTLGPLECVGAIGQTALHTSKWRLSQVVNGTMRLCWDQDDDGPGLVAIVCSPAAVSNCPCSRANGAEDEAVLGKIAGSSAASQSNEHLFRHRLQFEQGPSVFKLFPTSYQTSSVRHGTGAGIMESCKYLGSSYTGHRRHACPSGTDHNCEADGGGIP